MTIKQGSTHQRTIKPSEQARLDKAGIVRSHDNAQVAAAVTKGKGKMTAHTDPVDIPNRGNVEHPPVPPKEFTSNARPLEEFPDLIDVLPDMAKEYRRIHIQSVIIEKRKKELGSEITALLEAVGHNSIQHDDWVCIRARGRSASSISPEKLLEKGIESDIITACTVEGKVYFYAQVKAINGNE